MNPLAVLLKPVERGWAIELSNGRELARFTGLGAKRPRTALSGQPRHRRRSEPCQVTPGQSACFHQVANPGSCSRGVGDDGGRGFGFLAPGVGGAQGDDG